MNVFSAFKLWYADADMPEKVNGKWVDLETGIGFDPRAWLPKLPSMPELNGSEKQVAWATKIRNNFLYNISDIETKKRLTAKYLSSKFWIDNRNLTPDEMSALA